jgi:hypothetical protein
MAKRTVTNLDQGPRFIIVGGTTVVIPRGETYTGELTEAEVTDIEGQQSSDSEAPRFDVSAADSDAGDGVGEGEAKPLASRPVAELRKMADAEGVALTDRKGAGGENLPDLKSAADIAAAIEAKRAAG